jgi:hypothetical protein
VHIRIFGPPLAIDFPDKYSYLINKDNIYDFFIH